MPKYRATVQVTNLTGENPREVRAALDEQLRRSGCEHYEIVAVDFEPRKTAPRPSPAPYGKPERRRSDIGGVLLVVAAAWAAWFFWEIFSTLVD